MDVTVCMKHMHSAVVSCTACRPSSTTDFAVCQPFTEAVDQGYPNLGNRLVSTAAPRLCPSVRLHSTASHDESLSDLMARIGSRVSQLNPRVDLVTDTQSSDAEMSRANGLGEGGRERLDIGGVCKGNGKLECKRARGRCRGQRRDCASQRRSRSAGRHRRHTVQSCRSTELGRQGECVSVACGSSRRTRLDEGRRGPAASARPVHFGACSRLRNRWHYSRGPSSRC